MAGRESPDTGRRDAHPRDRDSRDGDPIPGRPRTGPDRAPSTRWPTPAAPHLAMTKGEMLEILVFSLLNGVLFGMLLFMLSSGLTLIFSMMGVLNFAHASFFMLGAYFAYQISTVTGFWIALILAPLLVGGIGMLIERYGLRRVHKYGHVAELLFTFGLPGLSRLHPADCGDDVRRPVPHHHPYPHRPDHSGGADPSRHGGGARP
jgi:hypothetical protein